MTKTKTVKLVFIILILLSSCSISKKALFPPIEEYPTHKNYRPYKYHFNKYYPYYRHYYYVPYKEYKKPMPYKIKIN
jgi:hypothetical protein